MAKPELIDLNLNTLEAWRAFIALRTVVENSNKLPSRTFLKARRILRDLQPHAKDREDAEARVLKDYAIRDEKTGKPVIHADGTVEWGDSRGADELKALNETPVPFACNPILLDELTPEKGEVPSPLNVMALEDMGIVVEEMPEPKNTEETEIDGDPREPESSP